MTMMMYELFNSLLELSVLCFMNCNISSKALCKKSLTNFSVVSASSVIVILAMLVVGVLAGI